MTYKLQAIIRAEVTLPYPQHPLMNDDQLRNMDGIFTTPIEYIEAESLDVAKDILHDKYRNKVAWNIQTAEWLLHEPT